MTTTTVQAAVSLRGLSRTYGTGAAAVRAVDDIDLDLPRGGWTAIMGPSGSGKSTLLHLAAGLERADAGRVVVAGAGRLLGATPEAAGSIVQGILGGLAVLGVFLAVAYPAARRDMAPLTATLTRRLRRRATTDA